MKKLGLAVAFAGATLALSATAQAAPVGSAIGNAAATINLVEKSQYVYGGYNHCWYRSGWHGAGWYRCGYRWRSGYGWGGVAGWNGWAAPGVVVAPAPGVAVVAPGVAVGVGPYFWNGRHYHHRRWHGGRWVYY